MSIFIFILYIYIIYIQCVCVYAHVCSVFRLNLITSYIMFNWLDQAQFKICKETFDFFDGTTTGDKNGFISIEELNLALRMLNPAFFVPQSKLSVRNSTNSWRAEGFTQICLGQTTLNRRMNYKFFRGGFNVFV